MLGEYDLDSIMHYGSHFFSIDGRATITPLDGSVSRIGQREYISDGDKASMIELYQSEYSLVSSSSASALTGSTIQLDMFVTNNSSMGANTARLETTVPQDTALKSFSSPSWVCQQASTGSNVVCLSPVLSESSSSTVSISLSAPSTQGEISFDTTLSANTHDIDQSNNTDSTSTLVVATSDDLIEEEEKAPAAPTRAFAATTPTATSTTTAEPELAAATASPEPPLAAAMTAPATSAQAQTFAAAQPASLTATSSASGGGSFASLGLLLLLMRRRLK